METKDHRLGPASCRVRKTNALPAYLRANTRELCCLEVPAADQGKGYATSLVHKVCREADDAGIVLVLWPQPWGEHVAMSRAQLIDWYAREFGFTQIQPEPPLMARPPHGMPTKMALSPVAAAAREPQ